MLRNRSTIGLSDQCFRSIHDDHSLDRECVPTPFPQHSPKTIEPKMIRMSVTSPRSGTFVGTRPFVHAPAGRQELPSAVRLEHDWNTRRRTRQRATPRS
jgi:hypothetical protein